MEIFSLASGSKGNVTLVQTNRSNVLIDVGLSMKKINERLLMASGIGLDDVDTILITHSHGDHIQSLKTIYNKYKHITFYCSQVTFNEIEEKFKVSFDKERFNFDDTIVTSTLEIDTFELQHDKDCRGYVVSDYEESLCFIADNGMFPYKLKDLPMSYVPYTYYMIESNYDKFTQYLDTKRDTRLKRRVLSSKGHSDNFNAVEKLIELLELSNNDICKCVMFTHLSEDCNNKDVARESHNAYIEVWGKKTITKNIRIKYAKQNEIETLN